jgi:hypothetical protein
MHTTHIYFKSGLGQAQGLPSSKGEAYPAGGRQSGNWWGTQDELSPGVEPLRRSPPAGGSRKTEADSSCPQLAPGSELPPRGISGLGPCKHL